MSSRLDAIRTVLAGLTAEQRAKLAALVTPKPKTLPEPPVADLVADPAIPEHISEAMPTLPDATQAIDGVPLAILKVQEARRQEHARNAFPGEDRPKVVFRRTEHLSSADFAQRERIRQIAEARARSLV